MARSRDCGSSSSVLSAGIESAKRVTAGHRAWRRGHSAAATDRAGHDAPRAAGSDDATPQRRPCARACAPRGSERAARQAQGLRARCGPRRCRAAAARRRDRGSAPASWRSGRGVEAGSRDQSTSARSTAASVSGDVVALERPRARQHLVEHGAERPDVAAPIGLASLGLLGAHVRRGAEQHAALDQRRTGDRRARRRRRRWPRRLRLHDLGQPEVEQLHRAVRPQLDVGGLEIAMDDALLVRRFEADGDLPRDADAPPRAGADRPRCGPPASALRPVRARARGRRRASSRP